MNRHPRDPHAGASAASPRSTAPDSDTALAAALDALDGHDGSAMERWLRQHLFEHVLPFWETHAIDDRGGLLTCLTDAGQVLSTDKWLWSQWRAVWVFSRIYNTLQRDPRWLRLAHHIANFCSAHGWDDRNDGWSLVLARDGSVRRGYESIYVDAFAIYGLVELHRADANDRWLQLACRTADAALRKLALPPDQLPHFPYPIPAGARPHGLAMIWSLKLAELAAVSQNDRYAEAARRHSDAIFEQFVHPEHGLIVEYIGLNGARLAPPTGTVVVPGHALECLWFQVHVRRLLGDRPPPQEKIFELVLRHLEAGWDRKRHGGISLAVDMRGDDADVAWNFARTKLWWPHTEALYASLLGWQETNDRRFLQWYARLWRFCAKHYVDHKNGEWKQKLNRDLQPFDDIIALPVKDPFHLPRSIILQIEAIAQLKRPVTE